MYWTSQFGIVARELSIISAIRAKSAERLPASLLKNKTAPMIAAVTSISTNTESKPTAISFARLSEICLFSGGAMT